MKTLGQTHEIGFGQFTLGKGFRNDDEDDNNMDDNFYGSNHLNDLNTDYESRRTARIKSKVKKGKKRAAKNKKKSKAGKGKGFKLWGRKKK